jgi:hypothetical protein
VYARTSINSTLFIYRSLLGTFTLLSCLISLWDITSHLRNYNKPGIQRRVCAILWMVPIYSVTSWLSLVFPASSSALGALRDCYEAYAIYTFVGFLIAIISNEGGYKDAIAVLAEEGDDLSDDDEDDRESAAGRGSTRSSRSDRSGSDALMVGQGSASEMIPLRIDAGRQHGGSYSSLVDLDGEEKEGGSGPGTAERAQAAEAAAVERERVRAKRLRPPFSCCVDKDASPWTKASLVIYQCQVMAMQFVLIKPILALMPVLFFLLKKPYDDVPMFTDSKHVNWHSPEVYTYAVENLSVMIAFYGLLSFYYAIEKNIVMYNPWPKFLCIKGVVFVTFWQGIAIDTMSTFGMSTVDQANQIQNFLICIEMLLASIAHYYIFPSEEWEDNYAKRYAKQRTKRNGLGFHDSLAFGDFASDVRRLVTNKDWAPTPTSSDAPTPARGGDTSAKLTKKSSIKKTPASAPRGAPAVPAPAPYSGHYQQGQGQHAGDLSLQSMASSPGDIFGSVVKGQGRRSPSPTSSPAFLIAKNGDSEDDESVNEAQV